jgi:hypothetical protein
MAESFDFPSTIYKVLCLQEEQNKKKKIKPGK